MTQSLSIWSRFVAVAASLTASVAAQAQSAVTELRYDVTSSAFVTEVLDASDLGRREGRQQAAPDAVLKASLQYFQRDCVAPRHRSGDEVRACSALAAIARYLLTGADDSLVGDDDAALRSARTVVTGLRSKIQAFEAESGDTFAIPRGAIKSTGLVTNNLRNTLAHAVGDGLGSSLQAAGAGTPVEFHSSFRDDDVSTWSIDGALFPETAMGGEAPELTVERVEGDGDHGAGGGGHDDFQMSGMGTGRTPMIAGDFRMSGDFALMSGMDMGMSDGFVDFSGEGDAPSRGIRASFQLIPGLSFTPSQGADSVDLPVGHVADAADDCLPAAGCRCAGEDDATEWKRACREVGRGAAITTDGRMPRNLGTDPSKVASVVQTIIKKHDAEMQEVARRRWGHPAFQASDFAVLGAVPADKMMREQVMVTVASGDFMALTQMPGVIMPGMVMPGMTMSGMPGTTTTTTTTTTMSGMSGMPGTTTTTMPGTTTTMSGMSGMPGTTTTTTTTTTKPTTTTTTTPTMSGMSGMPGTTTTTAAPRRDPNITIDGKRWTCSNFSLDGGATCSPAGGSGGGGGDNACKVSGNNAGNGAPQGARGDAAAANGNNCAANGSGGSGGYGSCPTAQGSIGVTPVVDSCPKVTVSRPWNGGRCNHIGTQLRSWSGPIGPGDSYGDTRWEECTEYMTTQAATGTCGRPAPIGSIWRVCYFKKRKGDLGFEYERDGRGNLVFTWVPVGANSSPTSGGRGGNDAERIVQNVRDYLTSMEQAKDSALRAAQSCRGKIQLQEEVGANAQAAYDDLKASVEDAGRKLIVDIITAELRVTFGDTAGQVLGSLLEILTTMDQNKLNAMGVKDALKALLAAAIADVAKKKGIPETQAYAIGDAISGLLGEALNSILSDAMKEKKFGDLSENERNGLISTWAPRITDGIASGIGGAIQDTINGLARQACNLAGQATSGSQHLGAALGSVCALLADIAQKEAKALFWNLRLIGCASDVRRCLNTVLFYQRRAASDAARLSSLKCAMKAIAEMGPNYTIDFDKIFNNTQRR